MTHSLRTRNPSLNDEIAAAGSEQEVNRLLSKGKAFAKVSSRTLNRWQRTAKSRIAQLNGGNGQ